MRAKRYPSLLGLAFLAAAGLAAAQPAHEASAAATGHYGDAAHDGYAYGYGPGYGPGSEYVYGCGYGGPHQAQWQYQAMGSSSLGTGPGAYPTAIIDID